jgi:hypothetical protein
MTGESGKRFGEKIMRDVMIRAVSGARRTGPGSER